MILFGECDYLPWSGALDYRKTLSNAKTYYVPRAGHFIQFEQPELMRRMIVAFLLDQPEPIPPYSSELDPRNANRWFEARVTMRRIAWDDGPIRK
jgi:proline iminopeptidase